MKTAEFDIKVPWAKKRPSAIGSLLWAALLISMAAQTALGQPPDLQWEKSFGGAGDERGLAIQETRDAGLIATGFTGSKGAGGRDILLIKTDKDGGLEWERTIGGPGRDEGWALVETRDGFVIAGITDSWGSGKKDLLLVKTDSEGYERWKKTFGGAGDDWGVALLEAKDGFVVAGVTTSSGSGGSDGWIVKTDPDGNRKWEITIGGSKNDGFNSILEIEDGYILAGTTESYGSGGKDLWIVGTDGNGEKMWEKTFGKGGDERGNYILAAGGSIYAIGAADSGGYGGRDLFVVKTGKDGEKIWEDTYSGTGDDGGSSALAAKDGGIIVVGYTSSQGNGDTDLWLLKIDPKGEKVWERTFAGGGFDLGRSIVTTKDGGLAIVGWRRPVGSGSQDLWLLKTEKLQ